MDEKNKLYFGDNLKILRDYVDDASVDLIYLDPACAGRPPFNSSATYPSADGFREKTGEESAAQQWMGGKKAQTRRAERTLCARLPNVKMRTPSARVPI
jgi:hypothetical protein